MAPLYILKEYTAFAAQDLALSLSSLMSKTQATTQY